MKNYLTWWNRLVGAMDVGTGLLLVFAPSCALRLLGLREAAAGEITYLSWVGVFVGAVGAAYFLAGKSPESPEDTGRWQAVWSVTALARTLVGAFVIWKIAAGSLEVRWITVAATDLCVAAVQWHGLQKGWLNSGRWR